jgi:hypothetical protein
MYHIFLTHRDFFQEHSKSLKTEFWYVCYKYFKVSWHSDIALGPGLEINSYCKLTYLINLNRRIHRNCWQGQA